MMTVEIALLAGVIIGLVVGHHFGYWYGRYCALSEWIESLRALDDARGTG